HAVERVVKRLFDDPETTLAAEVPNVVAHADGGVDRRRPFELRARLVRNERPPAVDRPSARSRTFPTPRAGKRQVLLTWRFQHDWGLFHTGRIPSSGCDGIWRQLSGRFQRHRGGMAARVCAATADAAEADQVVRLAGARGLTPPRPRRPGRVRRTFRRLRGGRAFERRAEALPA